MTHAKPIPITVIILTFNEEKNLSDCLASVAGWTHSIFLVDSGSTDRTLEIARQFEAQAEFHPFETHARQWNWGITSLPIETDWILCLDSDHRIMPELRDELCELFHNQPETLRQHDGFYIKRRQVFRGKWIRHGGYYPKYLLKLFRRDKVRSDEQELLDFRFYVDGPTGKLKHDLIEDNLNEADIGFWITKHNRFATLQSQEEWNRQTTMNTWSAPPRFFGTPDQRVLWLKSKWYRMPLYVRPFLYFTFRYFFQLGFLDGKQGFIFHFLQGFWYRLLVDIKLDELREKHKPRTFIQEK
ncbi:MAG: glycosyltransferase family 2 protein [Blastocatellia bacterium]|nr:glycosyltransferase family 2 protein [Blastocatellia bacterium]